MPVASRSRSARIGTVSLSCSLCRNSSSEPEVRAILDSFDDEENIQLELHKLAADLLNEGEIDTAWKVLMMG